MSKVEAQRSWDQWETDLSIARDMDGPREFLRLAIRTRSLIVNFEEISFLRSFTQQEQLSKNECAHAQVNM